MESKSLPGTFQDLRSRSIQIHSDVSSPVLLSSDVPSHMADAGIRFGFFGKEMKRVSVWTCLDLSFSFLNIPHTSKYLYQAWLAKSAIVVILVDSLQDQASAMSFTFRACLGSNHSASLYIDKDLGQRKIVYF